MSAKTAARGLAREPTNRYGQHVRGCGVCRAQYACRIPQLAYRPGHDGGTAPGIDPHPKHIREKGVGEGCWQGALSEYFYTSAHSIFIASLLGLATLFFVYRGSSDTESALLTLAGVAALTAALVPQGKNDIDHCTPLFIPTTSR